MKTLNEQKTAVLAKLLNGGTELEFIKADGSLRVMKAELTEEDEVLGFSPNDTVATVWDTEANGYRRFTWTGLSKVGGEIFDYAD